MKRSPAFIVSLLTLVGALCALGAPARAADTFRFSNSGNWAARYLSDNANFVVYDYRRSPGEAAVIGLFALDHPLADRAQWLITDDGAVWTIEGPQIVRHGDGKTQTVAIPLAGQPYEVVTTSKGPATESVRSAIYLQSLPRGRKQEVRCRLEAGLFEADGWRSLCKTTLIQLPEGSSFAYLEADAYDEDDADYEIAYSYNHVEGNPTRSSLKFFNGALASESRVYNWGDGNYGDSFYVSTNGLWEVRSANSELRFSAYLGKRPGRTIPKASEDWTVSADGRYVFFYLPRAGDADVIGVVDLDGADQAVRRVVIPGPASGVLVSPNGRFVIHGPYKEPRPVAMLTDLHFGMTPELVVDVLMARITKALAENRFADALPPLAEIEAMGLPLDEDFYFYQADTLARAGQADQARAKASAFVARYGRKSTHYARMVEILAQ